MRRQRRRGETADAGLHAVGIRAQRRIEDMVQQVHRARLVRAARQREREDAVVGLVVAGDVGAQGQAQHRQRARRVLAQPSAGGAQRVGDEQRVDEKRVAAVDGAGVAGIAEVVEGQQRLADQRAVDRVQADIVVVVDRLAAGQRGFGQRGVAAGGVVDAPAEAARDQPVHAAEVADQHAAESGIEETEAAGELAAEVVVGDRHRAEGKGRQRAPGRLVDAVVVHAQGRLAPGGRRQPRRQRAGKAHVDAAAQAGAPVLLVVGGDRAVGGQRVVGDFDVVAVADEHAAGRIDRGDAVVVDVVAADARRFHDGQRDAAAADLLRLLQHRLAEGVAQVVVQPVVQDHQVAHRVRRAQQRRQREVQQRGVDEGEQRRLGVVVDHRRRRAGQARTGAQCEADARQPHHRHVVGLDRDFVQEGLGAAERRGARGDRDRVDQHTLVAGLGHAHDAPLRRHVEQVAPRRRLDARQPVVVAAVAGGAGIRARSFEVDIDVGLCRTGFVQHQRQELAAGIDHHRDRLFVGGRVGGQARRTERRGRCGPQRRRRRARQARGVHVRQRRRRWRGNGQRRRFGRGRRRIEVAAERDAVAGAADDLVLEQAHALAAGAQVDAADRAVRLLRQQQRQRETPDAQRIGQHQPREAVDDFRPRAGVGRVAGRVVVGRVGFVRRGVDEGQQHQRVALDQAVVGLERDRRQPGDGVEQVQPVVGDLQLGRVVGAQAVHAADHAVVAHGDVAASAFAAALDQQVDAVVGQQVEVIDADADAVDEVQDR